MIEVKVLPYGESFTLDSVDDLMEQVKIMNRVIKLHKCLPFEDIEKMFESKMFEYSYFAYYYLEDHYFQVEEHPCNDFQTKKVYWIRYANIAYRRYKI